MPFLLDKKRHESENKTIRFPYKLVVRIEKVLEGTELNFSQFVIQACNYALDNMPSENKDAEPKEKVTQK